MNDEKTGGSGLTRDEWLGNLDRLCRVLAEDIEALGPTVTLSDLGPGGLDDWSAALASHATELDEITDELGEPALGDHVKALQVASAVMSGLAQDTREKMRAVAESLRGPALALRAHAMTVPGFWDAHCRNIIDTIEAGEETVPYLDQKARDTFVRDISAAMRADGAHVQ